VYWDYKRLKIDLLGVIINLQLAYYIEQYTIEYLIEDEIEVFGQKQELFSL